MTTRSLFLILALAPAALRAAPQARVALAPAGDRTLHLVVESEASFAAVEVGVAYDPRWFALEAIDRGPDFPSGGGAVFSDASPGSICPQGTAVEAAFTAGCHFSDLSGQQVGVLPPGSYRLLRLTFRSVGGSPAACSPLRFLRCLGRPEAPVRNVITDGLGRTVLLETADSSVCAGSCSTIAFAEAGRATCDRLTVEVREAAGGIVAAREVTGILGLSGRQVAAAVARTFEKGRPEELGVGLLNSAVRFCLPDGRSFGIRVDGQEILEGETVLICGLRVRGGLPACPDADLDGRCDPSDVCPSAYDPSQADADGDGVGDACDPCPSGPDCPTPFCLNLRIDPLREFKCTELTVELKGTGGVPLAGGRRTVPIPDGSLGLHALQAVCRAFEASPPPGVDVREVPWGCSFCRSDGQDVAISIEYPGLGPPGAEIPAGRVVEVCGTRLWVQPPVCADDRDGDGICNFADNCPGIFNPTQIDANRDGFGDDCRKLVHFRRGFINDDALLDISDAIVFLGHAFLGDPKDYPCDDALDIDDDSAINITDAIVLLRYLFQGGVPPEPPFTECGEDRTADDLGCDAFQLCR